MGDGDPGYRADLGQGHRLGRAILEIRAGPLDRRHPLRRDDVFGVAQQELLQPVSHPPQELGADPSAVTAVAQQLAQLGGGRWIGDDWPAKARNFAAI
jgi:hypothetical protein